MQTINLQVHRRTLPFGSASNKRTTHSRRHRVAPLSPRCDMATQWIEDNLGHGKVVKESFNGSSGWSSAATVTTEDGSRFFIKTARGRGMGMFAGESAGLQAMYDTHTIRVPQVFHVGSLSERSGGSFIVMEYLNFTGRYSDAEFGRQLALMHLAQPTHDEAAAGQFGFAMDNTIGGTPQPNPWTHDWVTFFREHRLKHMLELVGQAGLQRKGYELCDKLDVLFDGIEVKPSILHGDLWSGNVSAVDGAPAIFDPASYYGHHEAEFGMSWCASFGQAFWAAYHELIPRAPGFEDRKNLYMLYHYLNHAVLFGSGYYGQCDTLLNRLLKAVA